MILYAHVAKAYYNWTPWVMSKFKTAPDICVNLTNEWWTCGSSFVRYQLFLSVHGAQLWNYAPRNELNCSVIVKSGNESATAANRKSCKYLWKQCPQQNVSMRNKHIHQYMYVHMECISEEWSTWSSGTFGTNHCGFRVIGIIFIISCM